jgi:hypothetical protein
MLSSLAIAGPTPYNALRPQSSNLVNPPLVELYLIGDNYAYNAAILVET